MTKKKSKVTNEPPKYDREFVEKVAEKVVEKLKKARERNQKK